MGDTTAGIVISFLVSSSPLPPAVGAGVIVATLRTVLYLCTRVFVSPAAALGPRLLLLLLLQWLQFWTATAAAVGQKAREARSSPSCLK